MKRLHLNIIIILILSGMIFSLQSCIKKIDSTKSLLDEIENRYEGKWFKHVKFLQTTNFYKNDSIYKAERWAEEYVYPGQLIIKVDSDTSNNGYLYRSDSVYIFERNELIYKEQVFHDLVILSMDIYNMSSEESYKRFSELDYDLDKFDTREYNGRKVYVIGAEKGDTTSNQVWFDAEYLYFVKMIKTTEHGRQEVVFNDYININGSAWIEQEVIFYLEGKKYMEEKYYNIHIPDVDRDKLEIKDFKGFNISLVNPIEIIIENQIDKYIYSLYYMTLGGY